MLFRSTKWADKIHITLANVTVDIGLEPQAHAYFDTHVDWLNFDDELKRHVDPDVKKLLLRKCYCTRRLMKTLQDVPIEKAYDKTAHRLSTISDVTCRSIYGACSFCNFWYC